MLSPFSLSLSVSVSHTHTHFFSHTLEFRPKEFVAPTTMPKPDPDPHPAWSSSSTEQNSSPANSPTCWWRVGTSSDTTRHRNRNLNSSRLTKKNLHLHQLNHDQKNTKSRLWKSSPYYAGRTDSLLTINRKRRAGYSPEKESHATSGSSSSFSTVIHKIQEWGSTCFKVKPNSKSNGKKVVLSSDSLPTEKPSIKRSLPANTKEVEEKPKKDEEFNWANKHQPMALKDFICHQEKAEMLEGLARSGHFGHYIFEGPSGIGKRTMMMAYLRQYFKPSKLEIRDECREFKFEGVPISSIQVNLRVSSQHIEVNVPQLKEYAVEILLQLIEQINCKLSNQKHLQLQLHHTNHKAIVLHEAEQLSTDAQQYIRSLIQTNDHIMVIFCCSEVWKPQNIIYHCKVIQLRQPSNKEIVEVLEFIAKQEAIELPCQLVEDIAHKSKNNLRQAIRSFEATCRLNYPFKGSQVIQTGWEDELAKIAKAIVQEEPSLQQPINIRDTLAALKEHHLSHLFIFNTLVVELKKNIDDGFQSKFASFLQDYNNSNVKTESLSDENYEHAYDNAQLDMRIQEFIANFISFYKTLLKDKKKTGGVKLSSQGIPLMFV